ncbi:MAG: hypothetical protein IRZ33_01250 [Alicyclobacillaceae bacterium]|nr:hypothetical protein [Alicyclobacillaceae bacterium]
MAGLKRTHGIVGFVWMACLAWLLYAGVARTHRPWPPPHADSRIAVADAAEASALILSPAEQTWQGVPVFRLDNQLPRPLQHMTIIGWSGNPLPILGLADPGTDQTKRPPLDLAPLPPPYTLPAGGSVWFADGDPAPVDVTVTWMERGRARYAFVHCPFGN